MTDSSTEHSHAHEPIHYRSTALSRWFPLAVLTLITAIGVFGSLAGGPPPWFLGLWLLGIGWAWYSLLARIAVEVTLWPDTGRLQFRSLIRQREASLSSVSKIVATTSNNLSVVFATPRGSVHVMRTLDGLSDLVHRVREANPVVVTRGI